MGMENHSEGKIGQRNIFSEKGQKNSSRQGVFSLRPEEFSVQRPETYIQRPETYVPSL